MRKLERWALEPEKGVPPDNVGKAMTISIKHYWRGKLKVPEQEQAKEEKGATRKVIMGGTKGKAKGKGAKGGKGKYLRAVPEGKVPEYWINPPSLRPPEDRGAGKADPKDGDSKGANWKGRAGGTDLDGEDAEEPSRGRSEGGSSRRARRKERRRGDAKRPRAVKKKEKKEAKLTKKRKHSKDRR